MVQYKMTSDTNYGDGQLLADRFNDRFDHDEVTGVVSENSNGLWVNITVSSHYELSAADSILHNFNSSLPIHYTVVCYAHEIHGTVNGLSHDEARAITEPEKSDKLSFAFLVFVVIVIVLALLSE